MQIDPNQLNPSPGPAGADLRILVVGAGAVGGLFGFHLAQAGRDVSFLVRPERSAQLGRDGLVLRLDGREARVRPRAVTASELDDHFDLVFLAVKSYALDGAIADLAPAIGPATLIIPVLNGMRHVDVLRARFGPEHVLGGVCVVVSQLDTDGAIRQLQPGASLSFGSFDGHNVGSVERANEALSGAGFDTVLSTTVEWDMWEKWVFLAAGGALTTLLRAPAGEIMRALGGPDVAHAIIDEAAAVATALGFAPRSPAVARGGQARRDTGAKLATNK